jgi:hypothetical protein
VTTVRVATLEVAHFACGAVEVGRSWAEVELTAEARAVLLIYVGRIVQLHPADVAKLAGVGLALDNGTLREVPAARLSGAGDDPNRRRR